MVTRLTLVGSVALISALLGYTYWDSLVFLFSYWTGSDDYSHGLFVPAISLLLIWQARDRIRESEMAHAWWGIPILLTGFVFYWTGESATLYIFVHVSLWLVIVGLIISFIGVTKARTIAFPLFYLLTAIPLPVFLHAGLSSQLQLVSSALGVGFLQWMGVTAFREGNVIDLGPVQLQVVEACSGIRYLLPLTSLALLCAYLYKDRMWKRVVLVLSSIPISILVNGFRIGMIGVLVELYGQGAAEGFYHLFEGWVLFMTSLGLLILEMWLLAKIDSGASKKSLLDRFTWTLSNPRASAKLEVGGQRFEANVCFLFSVALLIPFTLASTMIGERQEVSPPRASFVDFPMRLNDWRGATVALEKQYIDALRFDDYVLADYHARDGHPLNFYSAYYQSQKKGQSAHSPQSCLPGGGWEISSLTRVDLSLGAHAQPFHVNRAVIQKNDQKQVVMYWFKQRDRLLADEYLVKFYLLWDALWRRRTDGALVRIASLVGPGETEDTVDQRLLEFAGLVQTELSRYVPD